MDDIFRARGRSKSSGLVREEADILGEVSDGGERLCQDKIFFTEGGPCVALADVFLILGFARR